MTISGDGAPGEKLRAFLRDAYQIPPALIFALEKAEAALAEEFALVDQRAAFNQLRLLRLFQENNITDYHLNGSTGYGYGDTGREALEAVFAGYFGCESALVRCQIMSGTHALALGLYANLRPGDELLSAAGAPYDTMQKVIGLHGEADALLSLGVAYREIPIREDTAEGVVDLPRLLEAVNEKTKLVLLQRSKGYSWRPSVSVAELAVVVAALKAKKADLICLVDNCYCEMTETTEPGEVGADLVIGSLIKNPGGTLAPCGGYIAGRRACVDACLRRLSAPGLSGDLGASMGFNRAAFQGLFQAPHVVSQSMRGALLAAEFFHSLGYAVMPGPIAAAAASTAGGMNAGNISETSTANTAAAKRTPAGRADIVQAIRLDDEAGLIRFCRAIQRACPLDAAFSPEPAALPGYDYPVIMAGGGFIQGSSSELSADGPLRPPYIAYLQGGFSLAQIRLGLLLAAKALAAPLARTDRDRHYAGIYNGI